MQSFTVASIIAFAAAVQAGPLAMKRADQCNVAPSAPTTANVSPFSQPVAATAEACQKLCEANASCQAFVFGLPESGNTPLCWLYNVPAAQIPPQSNANLKVFDKACTVAPTAAPTQADNQANNGQNQNQGQQLKKRNVCGAAPTGPAASSPSPLLNREDIATQDECLALCRQTSGCQAIEFGNPSADEPVQCLLFSVPASQLPAPTNGQTFVAFDTGC